MTRRTYEQLGFLIFLALSFAWVAWESLGFHVDAMRFPFVAGIAALCLIVIDFVETLRKGETVDTEARQDHTVGSQSIVAQFIRTLPYFLWVGGYYIGIYAIGFLLSTGIFVTLMLVFLGHVRVVIAVAGAIATMVFLQVFANIMYIEWPIGELEYMLDMRFRL